jgi:hypothetical protein
MTKRSGQRGSRVKVGPRDGGNFGQEDIAHHATADAGHHDGVQPECEPLRYRWARGLAQLRIPRDSGKRPTAN